MKNLLVMIYAIGALITFAVDYFSHYGEDSLLFWLLIREWISLFKAIVWPFVVLHSL